MRIIQTGVKINKNENEILESSDVVVQLGLISDEKSSLINKIRH